MKFIFNLQGVQKIYISVSYAFISTFRYQSEESDSDFNSDSSESNLSDFDPDMFGCGEITPEIESMVENTWEICDPLEKIYGGTGSEIIQETVKLYMTSLLINYNEDVHYLDLSLIDR